jgi:hypothetical protein
MMKLFRSVLILLALISAPAISYAQFDDQATWGGTAGGTANAQTLTIANYTLTAGVVIRFIPVASNTAAATINVSSTGAVAINKPTSTGLRALVGSELRISQAAAIMYNGSVWVLMSPQYSLNPTQQYLTTGTASTYTTPAGATLINITMIGGGGGGGGDSTNGGTGGTTSFNSVTAIGGTGGQIRSSGSSTGGLGGLGGSSGTGTVLIRLRGSPGGSSTKYDPAGGPGGNGGSGIFSTGAGLGSNASAGTGGSALANTGAGGGGPGSNGGGTTGGGGGGGGEYVRLSIPNPSGSYTYTIGAAGTAGTGTPAGGAGGTGLIIVDEYYN